MSDNLDLLLSFAKQQLYRSVISVNPDAQKEEKEKNPGYYTFGIKNTSAIPYRIFKLLRDDPQYLWLTVDKMADKGRSIDTDLINPITYRCMTGSSSGGAINIIKGINNFAIGTDGGGSVLAPALSCQLCSMIGAGLDLYTEGQSKSTDNIVLRSSVGVISSSLSIVKDVMCKMAGVKIGAAKKKIRVAIPNPGTCILPDQVPMFEKLLPYLKNISDCSVVTADLEGLENRQIGVNKLNAALTNADVVLTYEGPIDVYGYGETIPGLFEGKTGKDITENGGKFAVKCANICGANAITVPSSELAAGFVICAPHGLDGAADALHIADEINAQIKMPETFNRYYFTKERLKPGFKPNQQ